LLETIEHHPGEAINHVRILLDGGANPTIANHNGYTPLSNAAMYGNEEVVELLLSVVEQASAPSNPHFPGAHSWTPVAEASFHAHEACLRLLLDAGVDLELKTADDWMTPLHQAVRRNESSPEVVRLLLKHGSIIEAKDKKGFTPLALAVMHSTPEVVKALLNGGADTKTRFYAGDKPENGYSPLHLAVHHNQREVVEVLLDAGVDLEAQTAERKYTALMMATKLHYWEVASLLIDKGANVNTCDSEKMTPLMEAARDGQLWIVKELVDHHAELGARDSLGRTAWVWAKHEGRGSDFGDFLEDKSKRRR
jgi:ankyrin repeat protein